MATAAAAPTPNPNAMKFTLDTSVPSDLEASPFGQALLGIPGVVGVFGVGDFVTVTRAPDADWDTIVPAVLAAAADL
jgi:Scaffold protein Nfu/NifU N terminal